MYLKGINTRPSDMVLLQDHYLRNMHKEPQFEHVYITCQPFADNKPLCLPIKTRYRYFENGEAKYYSFILVGTNGLYSLFLIVIFHYQQLLLLRFGTVINRENHLLLVEPHLHYLERTKQ
jgi:hypothetical protein